MQNKNINLIRFLILKNCYQTKEGHVGSAFSILEILYIIFKKYIKKNFFILSKGHASIGMYAVMYFFKYINKKTFYSFCKLNSKLGGHPDSTKLPIFNFSTGSLGHGLPNSVGFAYALKQKKNKKKVICLMGDQELMEGTTWESLHAIDNYKLNNLVLIIDRNNSDFRSIKFLKLKKKLAVFCNKIYEVNGHNLINFDKTLKKTLKNNLFNIIIANTIKGYGIKSIADNPAWHHRAPTAKEIEIFKKELKV
jgi:transketolase